MTAFDVVIFGGSGFVGSSIASWLVSKGYSVKIADVQTSTVDGAVFERCDVRKPEEVSIQVVNVPAVINTAIIQIPRINEEPRLGYEVNIIGVQNICEAVKNSDKTRGLIQAGSWHTIGEAGVKGVVDERFGYRPDRVEERAKLYTISKIAQETIVRYYGLMCRDKAFIIVRTGTVLGVGMPPLTAASTFIKNALAGKKITPYKHSMYRPMLFVDIVNVCQTYEKLVEKIIAGDKDVVGEQLFNIVYPRPVTILDLANMVREEIIRATEGAVAPEIEIVDTGQPSLFNADDKEQFSVDISRASHIIGLNSFIEPVESIRRIIIHHLSGR
ncbi:MAG: NAD(P)-dependent oxidoreductase [Candidatus Caldarchaeum sp.]